MTNTASQTAPQVTSKPQVRPDDRIAAVRDAEDILNQVEDAIREIDRVADEIDNHMTELGGLDDLPEDVAELAEDLRYESWGLTSGLYRHATRLRNEIAAAAEKDKDDEEAAS